MKKLLVIALILLVSKSTSVDITTVELKKRPFYEIHYGFSPSPISPLADTYSLRDLDGEFKTIKPVIPKSELQSENGIIQILFRGGEKNEPVLVLVSNFKSADARFYIDHNQDYDFSNDSPALKLNDRGINIQLFNAVNPNGTHLVRLERMSIPNDIVRANWKKNIRRKPAYADMALTEPNYWFRELRHNILSADVKINDTQFQIGLMDANLNGIYNEEEDRILVDEYGVDTVSTDLNNNNYKIGDNTPFAVGNLGFKINSIDPTGTKISFSQIDYSMVPSRISLGDELPTTLINNLDNDEINLSDLIEKGKYNYIEFWGTWCKGCVQEIPHLKEVYASNKNRLNIIGLHSGASGETLKKFIEKKEMTWPQYVATNESLELLKVASFPYGILIDPKGKITAFNIRIDEVIKIIGEK